MVDIVDIALSMYQMHEVSKAANDILACKHPMLFIIGNVDLELLVHLVSPNFFKRVAPIIKKHRPQEFLSIFDNDRFPRTKFSIKLQYCLCLTRCWIFSECCLEIPITDFRWDKRKRLTNLIIGR